MALHEQQGRSGPLCKESGVNLYQAISVGEKNMVLWKDRGDTPPFYYLVELGKLQSLLSLGLPLGKCG